MNPQYPIWGISYSVGCWLLSPGFHFHCELMCFHHTHILSSSQQISPSCFPGGLNCHRKGLRRKMLFYSKNRDKKIGLTTFFSHFPEVKGFQEYWSWLAYQGNGLWRLTLSISLVMPFLSGKYPKWRNTFSFFFKPFLLLEYNCFTMLC